MTPKLTTNIKFALCVAKSNCSNIIALGLKIWLSKYRIPEMSFIDKYKQMDTLQYTRNTMCTIAALILIHFPITM